MSEGQSFAILLHRIRTHALARDSPSRSPDQELKIIFSFKEMNFACAVLYISIHDVLSPEIEDHSCLSYVGFQTIKILWMNPETEVGNDRPSKRFHVFNYIDRSIVSNSCKDAPLW